MSRNITTNMEKRVKQRRLEKLDSLHMTKADKNRHVESYFKIFRFYYQQKGFSESTSMVCANNKYPELFTPEGNIRSKAALKNSIKKETKKVKTVTEKLKDLKIYVVGGDEKYANWTSMELVDSVEQADLVMFTGGADVDPSLYAESQGSYTHINKERDKQEIEIFNKAVKLDKKIIGICRGAQLSCVLSGGKLIQDCEGHNMFNHKVKLTWKKKGETVVIPGDHHQMMYPFDMDQDDYRIVGYSPTKISEQYLDGNDSPILVPKDFREVEVAVFTKTKALAIQGHPEWDPFNSLANQELRELLYTFLLIKEFKTKNNEQVIKH